MPRTELMTSVGLATWAGGSALLCVDFLREGTLICHSGRCSAGARKEEAEVGRKRYRDELTDKASRKA